MARHKKIGQLTKDLNELSSAQATEKHIREAGSVLLGLARRNATSIPFKYATGELPQSISMAVKTGTTRVTAHVGTNLAYAPYIEFGTGQKGSASHGGTSPSVRVSYRTSPWYIHKSMVDPAAAEAYGWFKNSDYQLVTGQPAHPYLYPALKDNEKVILAIIEKGIAGVLGK